MSVRQRIQRLQRHLALSPKSKNPYANWLSKREWLTRFERWGREGVFANEPAFPIALAAYHRALEEAEAQKDLPFEPPADFSPTLEQPPPLLYCQDRSP